MKTCIKITLFILSLGLFSCEFEHPKAIVYPDISFQNNGLQFYHTNSIYDKAEAVITISRTYGLSKEIEMKIEVDPSLVSDYNSLYQSDYTVLADKYYELPKTITFPANKQTVDIIVNLNPSRLVKDLGMEKANKVILPVILTEANTEVDLVENAKTVLLNPKIHTPNITVTVPKTDTLSFLTSVPLVQDVTIFSQTNFNTLDVSRIALTVDESKVTTFNELFGTNFVLCPADKYSIKEDIFNRETMQIASVVTFDCSTLDHTKTYLLPLILQQTGSYNIVQDKPIYVVVSITDLRIWPTNSVNPVEIGSGNGNIELNINSPLMENLDVSMIYDIDKANAYNQAHGNIYKILEAPKVTLETGIIEKGSKIGYLSYNVDIKDLAYDNGDKYILAFTIDESKLSMGAQTTDKPTAYYILTKTITGRYQKEELPIIMHKPNSKNYNSIFNTLVMLVDGSSIPYSQTDKKQKYAINFNTGWADGLLYFDISDEEMEGKPGTMKIVNLQDRYAGWDPVNNFGSYLDTNTGEVFFNCNVEGYFNTAEINIRLYNKSD